jgi:hypothetical protein
LGGVGSLFAIFLRAAIIGNGAVLPQAIAARALPEYDLAEAPVRPNSVRLICG